MNVKNLIPSLWLCVGVGIFTGTTGCSELDQENADVASPRLTESIPVEASPQAGPKAEGDFPLPPDALHIEWKERPQLPELPLICNYEYSAGHTPCVAFGFPGATFQSESWNLATGTKIGQITNADDTSTNRSLSPDGTTIAFWVRERKLIEIWSYETGNRVAEVDLGEFASFLLASRERLIVNLASKNDGVRSYTLKLFDATSGELLKTVSQPSDLEKVLFVANLKVSSNGRYLAYFRTNNGFEIYKTDTLERIGTIPVTVIPKSSGGCAFSPDGTQLAGLSSDSVQTTIFVASLTDGSVRQFSLPGRTESVGNGTRQSQVIEWLPDQSGWVLAGRSIVDAKLERQVWTIEFGMERYGRNIVLPGSLIHETRRKDAASGVPHPQLQRFEWPHRKVRALAERVASGEGAILQPGSTLQVRVETSPLPFGDAEEATSTLKSTLEQKLGAQGMQVSDDDDAMILAAQYSEGPGRLMQRRGSVLSPVQLNTRTGIRSSSATIKLSMHRPDTDEALWSTDVVVDPAALVIQGKIDDNTIRDAVFKKVQNELKSCPIPFFISKDVTLPGLTTEES